MIRFVVVLGRLQAALEKMQGLGEDHIAEIEGHTVGDH